MMRRLASFAILLLCPSLGCVYYGLDVEDKACTSLRPCPPGYRCVEVTGSDGGMVCKPGSVDGGNGECTEGESRCVDFTALAECRSGKWQIEECQSQEYCFDAGENPAACRDQCDGSQDCSELLGDFYCNPDNRRCEERGDCSPPNEKRCSMDSSQVLYCDGESGLDRIEETCGDNEYCHRSPAPVRCQPYCNQDTVCSADPAGDGISCNLSSERCVDMDRCLDHGDCPDPAGGTSSCVGSPAGSPGACVIDPTEQATIPGGGQPVLTCYEDPVTVSEGPSTCTLEGRVVMFFTRVPVNADECATGLVVQLHQLDDILDGISDPPAHTATLERVSATPHDEWQYRIPEVPTNASFVMEVRCDSAQAANEEYRTLYTFEVYIRAEDCLDPDYTVSFGAPVLYTANYESYSEVPGHTTMDPGTGLLFGWLKDCQGDKLLAGTGGVSMAHDLLYYLPSSGPPDPTAPHSEAPGFFAAVNALPIRGVASALVLHQGGPLSLRSRDFRVFPGKASLVIFDRPQKPL